MERWHAAIALVLLVALLSVGIITAQSGPPPGGGNAPSGGSVSGGSTPTAPPSTSNSGSTPSNPPNSGSSSTPTPPPKGSSVSGAQQVSPSSSGSNSTPPAPSSGASQNAAPRKNATGSASVTISSNITAGQHPGPTPTPSSSGVAPQPRNGTLPAPAPGSSTGIPGAANSSRTPPPPPSSNVTLIRLNASFNFNPQGLSQQNFNSTRPGPIPKGLAANASAAIGVSVSSLAGTINATPGGLNGVRLALSCAGCGPNATSVSPILSFRGNATLANGAAPIAAAIASHNATLIAQFIANYTPRGFTAAPGTQQPPPPPLNGSAVAPPPTQIAWVAQGNSTRAPLNASAVQMLISNTSNLPPPIRAAVPYIQTFLNGSTEVNRTTVQKMYIRDTVQGSNVSVQYIPSNQTTYIGRGSAVASLTNVVQGFNTTVDVRGPGAPIGNITFSTRQNFTASVIGVKAYPGNATINASGHALPPPPGHPVNYVAINCSIGDASISAVNYTFNVSRAYVEAQNLTASDMRLYRYNTTTSTWVQLNTTMVGSNSTQYFFKARSPGMSLYVVSGVSAAVIANLTGSGAPSSASGQTNSTSSGGLSSVPFVDWVGAAIVIIVLLAAVLSRGMHKPQAENPDAA